MHYDSANTKISANSGVDQGCPPSNCGFSVASDPVLRSVLAENCTQYDSGAKLFAHLDDWYVWIKPQYLLQTFTHGSSHQVSQLLNCSPPRFRCGEPPARTHSC